MTHPVARWLESLGASRDVVAYAETVEGDRAAFWASCPRGDWLLAIALRTRGDDPARRLAILSASCAVAALGVEYLPDADTHARLVLSHTEGAARGGSAPATDDIDALERDADAAPDPAVAFARRAIAVCARALHADFDDLALVPSLVAQAAAHDAGDCAMLAAASFVLRRSAELVRLHVGSP